MHMRVNVKYTSVKRKRKRQVGLTPPFSLKQLVSGLRQIDNVLLMSYVFWKDTLESGCCKVFPKDFGMTKESSGATQQFLMG